MFNTYNFLRNPDLPPSPMVSKNGRPSATSSPIDNGAQKGVKKENKFQGLVKARSTRAGGIRDMARSTVLAARENTKDKKLASR